MTNEGERRRRRGTDWFAVRGAPSDKRAVRAVAVVAGLIVFADVLIPHLPLGPAWQRGQAIPERLHLAALAAPAVMIALRARHDRSHRFAWGALALGVAGNAIAEALMHLLSSTFPAPADGIKVVSYALLATGIALLTTPTGQALRSVRLDAAIVGLSVGAATTALWFESLARVSGDQLAVSITLSYPLLDVVLLVLIVAGLAPFRLRPTTSTLILSSGVVLFATVDILHLDQVSATGVATAPAMPELWAVGVLLFGLAAWAPSTARHQAVEPPHSGLSGIPVTFAFVSLAVLGIGLYRDVDAVALLLALAAVAMVVARTALTVRELRRANESFRLARTDELTSLTNRRGFLEGLDRLVAASPRPLAVLVADLNGFKDVNDSLGHHAGDDLLRLVAERFRSCLGTNSLLARLGGDEFGVVAVVDHPGVGMDIANALHSALDDPFVVEGVTIRIGAS